MDILGPGPKVIKLLCSTHETYAHNCEMPTLVGILTFMSMTNTAYESLKAEVYFSAFLAFMSSDYFILRWVEHEKSFVTSAPGLNI